VSIATPHFRGSVRGPFHFLLFTCRAQVTTSRQICPASLSDLQLSRGFSHRRPVPMADMLEKIALDQDTKAVLTGVKEY